MNRKILFIIGIAFLILISGFVIFKNSNVEKQEGAQVHASFYPLYFFASEIAGDRFQVRNITPSGIEPHDFDLSPRDIVSIQEGKLFIYNGAGFDPWVEKVRESLEGVELVNSVEGIDLLQGEELHEEELEGEEKHEDEKQGDEKAYDPHVWLSPRLAKLQAENILDGLVRIDPDNRAYYEENSRALLIRLDDLDNKFKNGLAECNLDTFVTSHAAFAYLANEYGLTQLPISGLSPDQEPTIAELAEITDFVRENNVNHIFFETLVSPKLSETIANEVGAQTLVLDPLEGLSDDSISKGENYLTVMESNLNNLRIALQCR